MRRPPAKPAPNACRAWQPLLALLLLAGCGGGSGGDPIPLPDPGSTLARVSGTSPVAAGCTGGRTSGTVFIETEVEPFAAVSPLNADHLVGVWQQDRASNGGARALMSAVSVDGGRSWSRALQPMSRCGGAAPGGAGDHERATDPWVDIGADGTVHMMGLAFSGADFSPGSVNEMLVSRSTDGGLTFSAPVSLRRDGESAFNDKNTLTADPTDARLVYAVWDRLDAAGNGPTWMARSSDGGVRWEPARAIVTPSVGGGVSQTIGNRIVVLGDGPDRGTLVNVFVQIDSVGGSSTALVRVVRSGDHGLSWSAPVTVAEHRSVGTRDPVTGSRVRDGAIVPAIAAGGSVLWVAWQDARFSGGLRDAIALSRSVDGGRSWSPPLAVNREPGVAAFTPTLQARADGSVALMHFDLRSDTADAATLLADLWLLTSRDGTSWTEMALARGFDLALAPSVSGGLFLGDYQGLVASGSGLVAFVALPGTGAANRSDVFARRVEPAFGRQRQALAYSTHSARSAPAGSTASSAPSLPGGLDAAAFERARSDAIRRAMAWRIPSWTRIVAPAADAQPGPPLFKR